MPTHFGSAPQGVTPVLDPDLRHVLLMRKVPLDALHKHGLRDLIGWVIEQRQHWASELGGTPRPLMQTSTVLAFQRANIRRDISNASSVGLESGSCSPGCLDGVGRACASRRRKRSSVGRKPWRPTSGHLHHKIQKGSDVG